MTLKALAGAAAAIALSAQGALAFFGDRVVLDDISPNYEPISVSVFAGSGGAAAIYGAPRGGADAETIASHLRLPAFVSPRRVTAGPTGERSGPHLVLVFAPKSGATPRKACRGQVAGGEATSELRVLGVFCSSYGTPVTEGLLIADGSPAPGDPDFDDAMRTLLRKVLPSYNPDNEGPRIRRR